MEIKKIFEILKDQYRNLNNLFKVAIEKQKALVKINNDLLSKCIKSEEKLLLNIQQTEKKRLGFIKEFVDSFNYDIENADLRDVMKSIKNHLSKEDSSLMTKYEEKTKDIIIALSKLNEQNLFLIKNSKQFVTDTINSLLSKHKKSLLDVKV